MSAAISEASPSASGGAPGGHSAAHTAGHSAHHHVKAARGGGGDIGHRVPLPEAGDDLDVAAVAGADLYRNGAVVPVLRGGALGGAGGVRGDQNRIPPVQRLGGVKRNDFLEWALLLSSF